MRWAIIYNVSLSGCYPNPDLVRTFRKSTKAGLQRYTVAYPVSKHESNSLAGMSSSTLKILFQRYIDAGQIPTFLSYDRRAGNFTSVIDHLYQVHIEPGINL